MKISDVKNWPDALPEWDPQKGDILIHPWHAPMVVQSKTNFGKSGRGIYWLGKISSDWSSHSYGKEELVAAGWRPLKDVPSKRVVDIISGKTQELIEKKQLIFNLEMETSVVKRSSDEYASNIKGLEKEAEDLRRQLQGLEARILLEKGILEENLNRQADLDKESDQATAQRKNIEKELDNLNGTLLVCSAWEAGRRTQTV